MSASSLTPRERVTRALRGDAVDRVPFAVWRHFYPEENGGAAKLAVSVSGSSAGPVSFAASSTLASSGGITNEMAMFSVQQSSRLSGGSDLSDLTVSSSGACPPGDYTLTVSATDGSIVYSVIVNLTLR